MCIKKQTTRMSSMLVVFFILFAVSCKDNKSDKKKTGDELTGQTGKKYIRYNAYDSKAAKFVQDLNKAYDSMRKLPCTNPLSWYYQSGIHQVPELVTGKNQFCPGYNQTSQALPVWNSCTHSGGALEWYNFAVWHRLYTWYLEKVVRKLSGNPGFALPYWGYCDTVNVQQNRTMPDIFRNAGSALYEKSRFDSLNNGQPISGTTIQALSLIQLFQNRDYLVFDHQLDQAPHGAMHNYIGAGNPPYHPIYNSIYQNYWYPNPNVSNDSLYGLMTSVESAGFDPIFFVHHAEIDRIWQQWTNSARGKEITLDGLNKYPWPYVFFDENGTKITYTSQMVMDTIYNLDYNYDDTPVKPKTEPIEVKSLSFFEAPHDTIVKKKIAQKITGNVLKFSVTGKKPAPVNLMGTNENNKTDSKIVLLTITVSYTKKAMGLYSVYVNLPAGAAPDHKGNYYAGMMTFFGSDHIHRMPGHMDMEPADKRRTKTFIFDLTDEFLATQALGKSKFDITIFKSNGLKNEDVTVEEVSISTH